MALLEKNSQNLSSKATRNDLISQYNIALAESILDQIGDLYINYDNNYKDVLSFRKEGIEYLLCDGRYVLVQDYPELAVVMNIPETDPVFQLPHFSDGTIRNLEVGRSRRLGSYEGHAMQKITGRIYSNDENLFCDETVTTEGAFAIEEIRPVTQMNTEDMSYCYRTLFFDSSRAVDPNGNPVKTDDFETRMKNTAVQVYIKAKPYINAKPVTIA